MCMNMGRIETGSLSDDSDLVQATRHTTVYSESRVVLTFSSSKPYELVC